MDNARSNDKNQSSAAIPLMVRLDKQSKAYLTQAAGLRRMSISDYVRTVTIAQAKREVESAGNRTIALSPEEQLAFWNALDPPPSLTSAQKQLGAVMRGEK